MVGGKVKSSTLVTSPGPSLGNHQNHSDYTRAPGRFLQVVCNYFHRRGHVLADCWSLQKQKPNALVHTVEEPGLVSTQGSQRAPVNNSENTYHPFISKQLVSLTGDGTAVPIRVLRHTEATQSLTAQNIIVWK